MSLEPPVTLAFLGIGLMGKPMAMNLLKAGFRLQVWNRTPSKCAEVVKAGAQLASSPAEAVQGATVVLTMLESGATVTEVLFPSGVVAACPPNTLFIDMSSIAPAIAKDHAQLLLAKHMRSMDAPVSGGVVGAEQGNLAIMAGGVEQDILQAKPIFDALGHVTHVGSHGSGQLCKLVNQTIVAITIGAVAEGLLLAKHGGADPAQVRKAILGGFCQSRILELHGQRMIERNFVAGGTVKNQIKDLKAVLEVAGQHGLQLPLTERVCELFTAHAQTSGELNDHSALYLQLEQINGLTA
jgi:2-hydroxy-3-oxopropionate reductase